MANNQISSAADRISAAQAVTANWADLGDPINTLAFNNVGAWLKFTHAGGSANFRIRAVGMLTLDGSDEYSLPIQTVNSTVVNVNPEYYEFDSDTAGQHKDLLEVYTGGVVPFVKLQVQAGTAGTMTVDSCKITLVNTGK